MLESIQELVLALSLIPVFTMLLVLIWASRD